MPMEKIKVKNMTENPLRPELIKEMEELLLAEKARVERMLSAVGAKDPRNPGNFNTKFPDVGGSEDDSAQEADLYSNLISQEFASEEYLDDVNAALERIANDEYGICKYCKKGIGEDRLRARPEASTHVECKKQFTLN